MLPPDRKYSISKGNRFCLYIFPTEKLLLCIKAFLLSSVARWGWALHPGTKCSGLSIICSYFTLCSLRHFCLVLITTAFCNPGICVWLHSCCCPWHGILISQRTLLPSIQDSSSLLLCLAASLNSSHPMVFSPSSKFQDTNIPSQRYSEKLSSFLL